MATSQTTIRFLRIERMLPTVMPAGMQRMQISRRSIVQDKEPQGRLGGCEVGGRRRPFHLVWRGIV